MNGDISRQNYLFQMQNDPEKQKALLEIQSLLGSNKSLFDVSLINCITCEFLTKSKLSIFIFIYKSILYKKIIYKNIKIKLLHHKDLK